MRIRLLRSGGLASEEMLRLGSGLLFVPVVLVVVGVVRERRILFVWDRARVRAPEMEVVGVREEGWVVRRRVVKARRRVSWMRWKGR